MLARFLGTSAGELYPGLWCRCASCERARFGEDPRDRRQSAALYVEAGGTRLLIDFPSEIASQAERHGVPLPELQHLLVTHSHGDHWFPYLLRWRARPGELIPPGEAAPRHLGGPRFTELPVLHVWGNAAVEAVLRRELGENLTPYALEFHPVRAGEQFTAGDLTISALAANHDVGREDAVHYVVKDGDCALLYGLDGDTFLPETRERLRDFRFDAVVMESTYGFGEGRNHRNFARVIEESEWLRREGLLADGARIIACHFSPHHCPPHAESEAYLRGHGIEAAWDGMEVRL